MRQKSVHAESPSERLVKNIRRATRREGIAESLYYAWSKEFLEAGKKRSS
jgi:transposase